MIRTVCGNCIITLIQQRSILIYINVNDEVGKHTKGEILKFSNSQCSICGRRKWHRGYSDIVALAETVVESNDDMHLHCLISKFLTCHFLLREFHQALDPNVWGPDGAEATLVQDHSAV